MYGSRWIHNPHIHGRRCDPCEMHSDNRDHMWHFVSGTTFALHSYTLQQMTLSRVDLNGASAGVCDPSSGTFLLSSGTMCPNAVTSTVPPSAAATTPLTSVRSSTAHSAPAQPPASHSFVGSAFIVLTVLLLVYVVGGILYNRMVLGATGWEQLPNYYWWGMVGVSIMVCTL